MNKNYKESFDQIKIAGNLAAKTLDEITTYIKPGVATDELDKICMKTADFRGIFAVSYTHLTLPTILLV